MLKHTHTYIVIDSNSTTPFKEGPSPFMILYREITHCKSYVDHGTPGFPAEKRLHFTDLHCQLPCGPRWPEPQSEAVDGICQLTNVFCFFFGGGEVEEITSVVFSSSGFVLFWVEIQEITGSFLPITDLVEFQLVNWLWSLKLPLRIRARGGWVWEDFA